MICRSNKSSGSQNKEPNTSKGPSRGYSFDLEGAAASSDKVPENNPPAALGPEYRLQRTTVLTGNHGKKTRTRAATESDQNLLTGVKDTGSS